MALTSSNYRCYWLASDCETCIMGITDAGVLETLQGFTVEAVDDLSIGDADLNWSTADANAECLVVDLPAGDSEEVPLMVLGQAIGVVDLGFFDGTTETNLAVVDLDKDSWVMLGFSADDIPALSCGGVATYIKFLDMVRIGAFNSTTQGSGIPLATATSGNFRVYSDDAGAAIANAGVGDTRGLLSRFLLTVDHSADEVRFSGAMGQVKAYDGIWGNEQVSGVYGYLELVRSSATLTLTDYGISAGSIACVENSGVVTIDTNHVLAGFAAISKITGDLTATGKTAGVLVTTYDTTNWSDATARVDWEYGLYIDSATVAGIEIADAPTAGILISGACTDGIVFTGTVGGGISFATATLTQGSANSFMEIGTYAAPLSFELTDQYFARVTNLKCTNDGASSKWIIGDYSKIEIDSANTQPNNNVAVYRPKLALETAVENAWGMQLDINCSNTWAVNDLIGVGVFLDLGAGTITTTPGKVAAIQADIYGEGTAGVTGNCYAGLFRGRGNITGVIDAIVQLENQNGAITAALGFDIDGSCSYAFNFGGTVPNAWTTADAGGGGAIEGKDEYVLIPVKVAGVTPTLYLLAAETWS